MKTQKGYVVITMKCKWQIQNSLSALRVRYHVDQTDIYINTVLNPVTIEMTFRLKIKDA